MNVPQHPEYIGQVRWMFSGPSLKSGGAAKRGFTVVFTLLNKEHQSIAVNGKLEVIVKHRNNNPFSKQKYTFPVSVNDFGNFTLTNYGRHLGEIQMYGCLLRHDKPVIVDNNYWMVELWFTTTDGRKLYGKSE